MFKVINFFTVNLKSNSKQTVPRLKILNGFKNDRIFFNVYKFKKILQKTLILTPQGFEAVLRKPNFFQAFRAYQAHAKTLILKTF